MTETPTPPVEHPVRFRSAGLELCGILSLPPGTPRGGAALVHGWGGRRVGPHRMLVRAAHALNATGFAALRFDLRGRGDSEGDASLTDLDGMIEDALAASAFLRQETGAERSALIGICSGANVAIGAATLDERIQDLALWSALPFQPEQTAGRMRRASRRRILEYARKALRWNTWRRLVRGEVDLRGVRKALHGESPARAEGHNLKDSRRNLMEAFAVFHGRALFLTGTRDPEGIAGREVFLPFCRRHAIRAEFDWIEGATHSYYQPEHSRQVIARTTAWLCAEAAAGETAL